MSGKEKEVGAVGPVLWRCNYEYVTGSGKLSNGSLVLEASTASEAEADAGKRLKQLGIISGRVKKVSVW